MGSLSKKSRTVIYLRGPIGYNELSMLLALKRQDVDFVCDDIKTTMEWIDCQLNKKWMENSYTYFLNYHHYSQITYIERCLVFFCDHQMKRVLKVLSNQSVNHMFSIYCFIDKYTEWSLTHCTYFLSDTFILDVFMGKGLYGNCFFEKL